MPADIVRANYEVLAQIAITFDQGHERIEGIEASVARRVDILRNGGWI